MDTEKSAISNQPRAPVGFGEAFRYWLKLGFISFGGPTGQIAIMHQDLVERKRWISEKRFLHALNYCMVLPGPEAQQLATYIGWMMHRTWGGVISGGLFVLPSLFILIALTWVYLAYGNVPLVAGLFYGIKRSEEHTSELQSLRHLVCRLLLEKKKKICEIHSNNKIIYKIWLANKNWHTVNYQAPRAIATPINPARTVEDCDASNIGDGDSHKR